MSSDIAVSVRGLSKCYTIQHNDTRVTSAKEALVRRLRNPLARPQNETFWALKDVNFDVHRGDVVGIIGRNGAGKSTLLKVLSRITEPTSGEAVVRGRLGSLLEVGTGFHPELTGRENVYLNGAILGMGRREIDRQFDAIVDFSGTERFLDTPVKRYSSGMYVRLAFAVAAHLEPEILIVDEVLAVGDSEFQKKCLGKMKDVAGHGRTVLFVSHSMTSVLQLCNKGVYLKRGQVVAVGPAEEIVDTYVKDGQGLAAEREWTPAEAPGGEVVRLLATRIMDDSEKTARDYYYSDAVNLEMTFEVLKDGARLNPSFHVNNLHGLCLFAISNMTDPVWGRHYYDCGIYRTRCRIPARYLNDGTHQVSVIITWELRENPVEIENLLGFEVHDDGTMRGDYTGPWIGAVRPDLPCRVESTERAELAVGSGVI